MANKSIKITRPKGIFTSKNGQAAELSFNPDFAPRRTKQFSHCQEYIDEAVLKYSSPYVPMDTGMLDKSGILGTDIGSAEVQYITPYAAKIYYHPEYNFRTMPHAQARGEWFEGMKERYKATILATASTFFD